MRTPVYGELFRAYKTKVESTYTIRDQEPHKDMIVHGICSCFSILSRKPANPWHTRYLITRGYSLLTSDLIKRKGCFDKNLIPICSHCSGVMPVEYLDGYKATTKSVTYERSKRDYDAGKSFRYRIDPVSRTGNWKGGYSVKTSGLKGCIIEASKYPKFTRGRRSVKTLQDVLWREKNHPYGRKSWKDCSKKRYQWMKKHNKSRDSIDKQEKLFDKYLQSNDNYLNLKYETKLKCLIGD